jgi:hypothetical protein
LPGTPPLDSHVAVDDASVIRASYDSCVTHPVDAVRPQTPVAINIPLTVEEAAKDFDFSSPSDCRQLSAVATVMGSTTSVINQADSIQTQSQDAHAAAEALIQLSTQQPLATGSRQAQDLAGRENRHDNPHHRHPTSLVGPPQLMASASRQTQGSAERTGFCFSMLPLYLPQIYIILVSMFMDAQVFFDVAN